MPVLTREARFIICVDILKDFIAQEGSANGSERQIAVLNVTGDSGSDPNDHYVPDPEWQAMPRDEKTKIIAACTAAREANKSIIGGSRGGNGKKKRGSSKKSKHFKWMKNVKRQVAEPKCTE